jgi:hypothetical protein
MALLFTFVLLGGSLIWSGLALLSGPVALFALAALLLRPVVYFIALAPVHLEPKARIAIAWFGPRGLSSLLLVLLPVFAGIQGSEYLFALCSVVVLLSLAVHGGTPAILARVKRSRDRTDEAPGDESALPAAPPIPLAAFAGPPSSLYSPLSEGSAPDDGAVADRVRISIAELRRLWEVGEPVVLLDVRTERSYNREPLQAAGSVRLQPDAVAERAVELDLSRESWIVAYCT